MEYLNMKQNGIIKKLAKSLTIYNLSNFIKERISFQTQSLSRSDNFEISYATILNFINDVYQISVPKPGDLMEFSLIDILSPIIFEVPLEENMNHALWCFEELFSNITLDNILTLLCAILLEKSVICYSSDLRKLSRVIFSFYPLLHPFAWQGVIIPILPRKLYSFIQAPVPIIVGINQQISRIERSSEFVFINLDENRLLFRTKTKKSVRKLPRLRSLKSKLKPKIEEFLLLRKMEKNANQKQKTNKKKKIYKIFQREKKNQKQKEEKKKKRSRSKTEGIKKPEKKKKRKKRKKKGQKNKKRCRRRKTNDK
eukprot:Anaeramoba_ignava/a615193_20.p1 GENE.a615193_20~~a615193_20.p1  ORF type:complete len:312 (-),score=96.05 a615193_20:25-960(-)